jgi:hypothetical protein
MAGTIVANTINTDTGVFLTNNAYNGIAKTWVQFAGSTGTIAGSLNVSSITRTGVGNYAINFTTAMPNANYCSASLGSSDSSGTGQMPCVWTVDSTQTTTTYQVRTGRPSIPGIATQTLADLVNVNVVIFSL